MKEKWKTFPFQQKQREFVISKSAPQEILKESPLSWNERRAESNLKPYEEIKNSSEGNCVDKYASIIVFWVFNCSIFLDLKDKYIKYLQIYINKHTMYGYNL